MFNRFLDRNLQRINRHLGQGGDNQARQRDTATSGTQTTLPQANPLLEPLTTDTTGQTQAHPTGPLQRLREFFQPANTGRNDTAPAAATAATPATTDVTANATKATTATAAGATAASSADDTRHPLITRLVHRIKTCEPASAPALIADLRQALHLGDAPPRLAVSAVREMLASNDWIEAVIEGKLDLPSLLSVIGKVTDLTERRALMGAIEAAVAVRQQTDQHFADRMNDRLGVPAAAPKLPADAVQAKVNALYENPESRQHIDSVITMFRKLGTGTTAPAQAIAANLSTLLNRMSFFEDISPELQVQVMPRLIENLLFRGDIDTAQARVAREGAARARDYFLLLRSGTGSTPQSLTRKTPWSCRLIHACIDEEWLMRRLAAPDSHAEIVQINHRLGRLTLKRIEEDLRKTMVEMESAGFLQSSTLAQLRACLPAMLEAIYVESCKVWGEAPTNARAQYHPAPAPVAAFTRAELIQQLNAMSPVTQAQLMKDLLAFFRNGTMAVEGHAFIQQYGDQISVVLSDAKLARAVLAHLKLSPSKGAH